VDKPLRGACRESGEPRGIAQPIVRGPTRYDCLASKATKVSASQVGRHLHSASGEAPARNPVLSPVAPFPLEDSMEEQLECAIFLRQDSCRK